MKIYDCLNLCIDDEKNISETVKMCMTECEPPKYAAPLIWVGFYIAAASLLCMLAMGTDLFNGLRRNKSWFPCKFFILNAAISALLAIALKMPVDLSTSMPCGRDQLMKLSATALMSVSMGNFLPSLADMPGPELLANLMALAVFIVPLISNIFIQIGTQVIYKGVAWQHIIIIFCILFQFALLVSTAIASPTMKQQLVRAYNKEANSPITSSSKDINEELKKHWIMAQTSSPQFVIARSVICTASGAFCVLTVLVLAEAIIELYITMSKYFIFYFPNSEYDWSADVIVSVQVAAVIVGSISPISRWFTVVWFMFEGGSKLCSWGVESYWTERLQEWKEKSKLNSDHHIGNVILNFPIKFQLYTVLSCKFFCLVSLVFLLPFMFVYRIIIKRKKKEHQSSKKMEYQSSWVLKLDKEMDFPTSTLEKIISVAYRYFNKGTKKTVSEDLINLLKKSYRFDGMKEFDRKLIIEELNQMTMDGVSNNPNDCWAIRIVTLSTIVCAIKATWDEEFVSTVTDLLPHVMYVEKALGAGRTNFNLGDVSMYVWWHVQKSKKWLQNTELPINGESLKSILETLKTSSPEKQKKYHPRVAMWMNETVDVVIKFLDREEQIDRQRLLDLMTLMVLDMLVTCLLNLETAMIRNILMASIEKKESVVKKAVSIYRETRENQNLAKEIFSSVTDSLDLDEYLHVSRWKALVSKIPLDDAITRAQPMNAASHS